MSNENQPQEKAQYRAIPELSPYINTDRHKNPKEDFKTFGRKLASLANVEQRYTLADLGCANGELIYYLQSLFPNLEFYGYDMTQDFVDVAKSMKELKAAHFECQDIFNVSGQFDFVVSCSTVQIFPDIQKIVDKALSLCKPGGYVLLDGLFNPYDVEVRIQYCDNSTERGRGLWRADWNTHSQKIIREIYENRVSSIDFEAMIMDVDLPRKEGAPDANTWTFRTDDGKNILTNGLNIIKNKTLMTLHK